MSAAEIPEDAVELRTVRQAAFFLQVRLKEVPEWLTAHGIAAFAQAPGTIGLLWRAEDIEHERMLSEAPPKPIEVRTAKQAAAFLEIKRPNLDKWLRYRVVVPFAFAPKPVGRLYRLDELAAAKRAWLRERDREADEKRRVAAMANVNGE